MFSYKYLVPIGILICTLLQPNDCLGQKTKPKSSTTTTTSKAKPVPPSAPKDTAIVKLFKNPALVRWTKTFKGRFDDAARVDVALGYDGTNCLGYLTYLKSRTRFRLQGTIDSNGLNLEERDMAHAKTGSLKGTIEGRHLDLEWTNADNSLGSRIEGDEIPPQYKVELGCDDNKWSSRYITRFNDARCDMVLVRSQNGALDGFLWVEADDRTYKLKGEIKFNGDYELEALAKGDRLAAMLSGNLKPGQNTLCKWIGSGEHRDFKFILKDHFKLGCYDYADYASSYDVLYPVTPCAGCNSWMDNQVTNWVERCNASFAAKKVPLSPGGRNAQRASAWSEIACWTDNLFSGYLTFSDTWTDQAQGICYNFDLRTGKQIELESLFQKSFNYKNWFNDFAAKEMPKLYAFASDPKYRERLSSEGFPLVVIRRDGFEMSTLFHPQYGRQTLFIPYESLKPYLKRDGAIAEFLK
ncbi:MAG: hypothetical protein R3A50_18080 [Saprospiraceae bacterium]